MQKKLRKFTLHGDNVVECDRVFNLIVESVSNELLSLDGPYGSPTNPSYTIELSNGGGINEITFFPGFDRWNFDVKSIVKTKGGILRESPDILISETTNNKEEILFAIEYSAALPAGNQAWQRSGRAYSYGLARIPYFYIVELGGYELDAKRNKKAPRFPNPAVPFSYVCHTRAVRSPVLPVFRESPAIDVCKRKELECVFGNTELKHVMRSIFFDTCIEDSLQQLENKAVGIYSISRQRAEKFQ